MNELELFAALVALNDAEERAALLDRHCDGLPERRQRLEQLLDAHFQSNPLLDPTNLEPLRNEAGPIDLTADFGSAAEQAGSVVAQKYKLLQQIGEGGMGTVWMADQSQPVKRRVAVKLIRVERGQSKTILARFEAERQAIALMDHPHIAKLLDAGSTETGAPYFVMELVKGIPLTDYCDQHRLSVPDRLTLFAQVCGAVQHAHQKGIIHRDLKPSNILVENHDGKPVPKIIDFGLAKATSGLQLTDQSLFTAFGSVMGTPLYMAPEQANFNAIDVDTRADIYSLGVILYELLTGGTPITRESLKKAALDEMLKLIRNQQAPTPSSRLSTAESTPSVASNRQMEPGKLGRFVKGELDWIVLKALSKERDRRYETANGFARDIERFLSHEPVQAGPPSAAYKFRKFVQRNRGQVIAASLIVSALLLGMIGTTWGLWEARKQTVIARQETTAKEAALQAEAQRAQGERLAKLDAQQKEKLANDAADKEKAARLNEERERGFAQAITDFVKDDFLSLTSVEGQGRFGGEELDRNATLLDLLNRAAEKLKQRKDLDPRVEAELYWIVGLNYRGSGEAAKGVPFLERAVELRTQLWGDEHPDTMNAQNSLSVAYDANGQRDKARLLYEETLRLSKLHLGLDHPVTHTLMINLAGAYRDAGQLQDALLLYQEACELYKNTSPTDRKGLMRAMAGLAATYSATGQIEKALPLQQETVQLTQTLMGPKHSETLIGVNGLARTNHLAGFFDKALSLYEENLAACTEILGEDHPITLDAMAGLAGACSAIGQFNKSLQLRKETYQLRITRHGLDHPATLNSMKDLATGYQEVDQIDQALPLFQEAQERMKVQIGSDHPDTLHCLVDLANAQREANQLDQAIPLFQLALRLCKQKLGIDHPTTLRCMGSLANAYKAVGQPDESILLSNETVALMKSKLGLDHPETLTVMGNLAGIYLTLGELELAIVQYEEILPLMKVKLGNDHPKTLICISNLAEGYLSAGKLDLALPLFQEVLPLLKAILGSSHRATLICMGNLAGAYQMSGQPERAITLYEDILPQLVAKFGRNHVDTRACMANLADCHQALGNLDQQQQLFEEVYELTKSNMGSRHSETINAMKQLAVCYWRANLLDRSIPLFEEALQLQEAKFGRHHNETLATLANLGINYKDAGRFTDAIQLLEEVQSKVTTRDMLLWLLPPLLNAYAKAGETAKLATLLPKVLADARTLAEDSPDRMSVLTQIGASLLHQQRWIEAGQVLRESLAIGEKIQPDEWRTYVTKVLLGHAVLGQGNAVEAEQLLLNGYEGLNERKKSVPPIHSHFLPEALDHLIELYTLLEKPEQVAKWQAEKDQLPSGSTRNKSQEVRADR